MRKKIIITGATGYIGTKLVKFLKEKKIEIKKVKTKEIKKYKKINKNYDFFIHLGFDIKKNCKINEQIKIIKDVLYISKKNCKNLIFLSSSAFGPKNKRKIFANNNYQKAKFYCEKILNKEKDKLNITILRVFNIIGPNQKRGFLIPDLISKFIFDKNIYLQSYLNKRDFIHVNDVCRAIYSLIINKNLKSEIFEVGTGRSLSIYNIAKIIKNILKSKKTIIKTSKKFSKPIITKAVLNYKKFKWKPKIKIENAIKDIIRQYEKKNWDNLREI